MPRRAFLAVLLLCWTGPAFGGTVVDATGRSIEVPERLLGLFPILCRFDSRCNRPDLFGDANAR